METKKIVKGVVAAGVASLLMMGAAGSVSANEHHAEAGKVKCEGGNACKGHGACKGAHNACKGHNECKGKGFVETADQAACDAAKKANGHH